MSSTAQEVAASASNAATATSDAARESATEPAARLSAPGSRLRRALGPAPYAARSHLGTPSTHNATTARGHFCSCLLFPHVARLLR
jgi:hypothetical protein